jgi:hypothetical protein
MCVLDLSAVIPLCLRQPVQQITRQHWRGRNEGRERVREDELSIASTAPQHLAACPRRGEYWRCGLMEEVMFAV